jgi:hypothetical protein
MDCGCAFQASLSVSLMFTSYILQQRYSPFLLLRTVAVSAVVPKGSSKPATNARVADSFNWALNTSSHHRIVEYANPIHARAAAASAIAAKGNIVTVTRSHWPSRIVRARTRIRVAIAPAAVWLKELHARVFGVGAMNYNHLENAFLVCSILILLSGMVFTSRGFAPESVGFVILTAVVAVVVIMSTVTFMTMVGVEVFRSFKNARLYEVARQVEIDAIEKRLRDKSSWRVSWIQ